MPISGTLALVVADIGDVDLDLRAPDRCAALGVGDPAPGEAVFCVVLRDRAGNDGPGDCTVPIALVLP